ncbi:enoyl-CoA hydratase-related protein [Burkholderia sola]|uniref:enoyl-CoA hydratase-related protein n=1 Tax=Burkholderia sola TaxID=2843302 RepID=UPI001C0A9136|nr:fatty acid degradation protein [Burkholderia cenocepacia]CAG2360560.1 fatty acid degradation protein [Burkholderia cenocepacia]CAG2360571.1 fatty acid degradation protein [Burkholderia cenocepacia]CAG2360577.1 fatty acid degradation protein [Burkholderia cenocepacia]CAG2360589.1 fatty acid degradation protein [Burkholderia cenocepacia]
MRRRFDNVEYRVEDEVAIVTMSHPPVNRLCLGVRRGLVAAFEAARRDVRARAIVLNGSGRGFCAGGDIREFGTPAAAALPALSLDVHPVIEASEKPVVAAIHGFAIGGGLETALVCHYRLVAGNAQIGLPECKLGVIPLSGTQRLPRVLGLAQSIEFILGAQIVSASEFAGTALFDRIVDGDEQQVLRLAIELARENIGNSALPLIRRLPLPDHDPLSLIAEARARLASDDGVRGKCLDAIAAAAESVDFEAGLATARAIYDRLASSDEVSRRRDCFFESRDDSGAR